MNTTMVPCLDCGAGTFTNAAETCVRCLECRLKHHLQEEALMSIEKALEQEKALKELMEKVGTGEVELPPKKPKKDTTPEDVLRALAKRPELLQGVADLISPKDLDGCVNYLLATMSKSELAKVKAEERGQLITYHHGFCRGLRNFFLLWERTKLVEKLCEGKDEVHPDTASMVILETLWGRVQEMDL